MGRTYSFVVQTETNLDFTFGQVPVGFPRPAWDVAVVQGHGDGGSVGRKGATERHEVLEFHINFGGGTENLADCDQKQAHVANQPMPKRGRPEKGGIKAE